MSDLFGVPAAPVVATAILLLVYALLISERLHRAVAGMLGAFLMVLAGSFITNAAGRPFYPTGTALGNLTNPESINTIGLLLGMMIIVGILSETGVFSYLAIKAAKAARGNPWRMLLLMTGLTAFLSAFLDNVTTILLILPVTILICRKLNLRPLPYILANILASNIGGVSTLVGDPPNILIGSSAHISFNEFAYHLVPSAVVMYFAGILFLRWHFRSDLARPSKKLQRLLRMDERKEIKDWPLLRTSLSVLVLVVGFFMAQDALAELAGGEIPVAAIALAGATILLTLTRFRIEDVVLHHIEWPTLLFFGGLFILIGGLASAGVLSALAGGLGSLTGGNLVLAVIAVLWISSILSAFLDNIPFAVAMIPVIHALVDPASGDPGLVAAGAAFGIHPLWWALAIGAGIGGNGTLVGASANIVGAGLAEKAGITITFKEFLRVGFPYLLVTTAMATAVLVVSMEIPGYWHS